MRGIRYATITVVLLTLSSCGSFNNSFNGSFNQNPLPTKADVEPASPTPIGGDDEPVTIKNGIPIIQGVPQKIIIEAEKPECSTPPYPPPGHPPELPKTVSGDVYAVERMERRYIDDLRAYISERRRLQREYRQAFEEKCKTVAR